MPQTLFNACGGLFNTRGGLFFYQTMPFPMIFTSHTDLLQSLQPPLLDKMDGELMWAPAQGLRTQQKLTLKTGLSQTSRTYTSQLHSLANNATDSRRS